MGLPGHRQYPQQRNLTASHQLFISSQLHINGRFQEALILCICRAPFKKPYGWLTWGLLGVVLSPVVIGLTVTALTYSGYEVCSCWHACQACLRHSPRPETPPTCFILLAQCV